MSEVLRNKLVDQLKDEGAIINPSIEAVMRRIPREKFATWLSQKEAYSNKASVNPITSSDDISTISQPFAVARFLEGFNLKLDMNVLEIGAGTGYQAALISELIGAKGTVTTVEIAEPLIAQARQNLSNLQIENVQVIHGDGALGYLGNAPYDRIVATVGLREIPTTWIEQLKKDGYIVAPLHIGGDPENHVLVSLKREGNKLTGRGLDSLDMVVLRGEHASTEEQIKRGENWNGGFANSLKIQILPKDFSLEPTATQKLIHKINTTILVEAI